MLKSLLSAIAVLIVFQAAAHAEPKTWEYVGDGKYQQVATATSQPAADPALDRIDELLHSNQASAAKNLAIQWLKSNRNSPQRDRGLFLTAQALYQYGDRIKAFYYLDELMDEYPESRLYYNALENQYQIADEYLNGYKRRFMGVPFFTAEDEAIEMLFRIQQRSPGSPLAEKSLLRTADYYYSNSDFDFAADVYAAYARSYPRSPNIPRVRLRQAYSSLAQFRGARFDATSIIDAREQLLDLMTRYPDLAAQEHLQSMLEQIDASFAKKLYLTADFYRRTKAPRAAAYTYRYLIKAYPDSPEAKEAQRQLDRLPKSAQDVIEPAVAKGYAPASASEGTQIK